VRSSPLATLVWMAFLGGGGLAVVAAVAGPLIGAGEWYGWKATGIFAGIMVVACAAIARWHPHPVLGAANLVTTIRVMGVALVAGLVGEPATATAAWAALATTAVIVGLDGVDGWLARRDRTTSAFGASYDMETDAFLILVLTVLVWQHDKAGVWVLAGGVMRYGFVAAGWWWPWMAAPLGSSLRGKAVAVAFIAGLAVALAPAVPVPFSGAAAALVLGALAWSFLVDIRWLYGRRGVEG